MSTHPGTSATLEIAAPAGVVLDVVAEVEQYPRWTSTVSAVQVRSFEGDGWPDNVEFTVTGGPLKDTYTVDYDWDVAADGSGDVTYALVSSPLLSALDGTIRLRPVRDGAATEVTYRLALDVNVPMLGLLKRRVERSLVSSFVEQLKSRAESRVAAKAREHG